MSDGNGHILDDGLHALMVAFEGAKFLDADAKAASELIVLGNHREQGVPDNLIMEIYASITEGKNIAMQFMSDAGNGYKLSIESYGDLVELLNGTLEASVVDGGSANDP